MRQARQSNTISLYHVLRERLTSTQTRSLMLNTRRHGQSEDTKMQSLEMSHSPQVHRQTAQQPRHGQTQFVLRGLRLEKQEDSWSNQPGHTTVKTSAQRERPAEVPRTEVINQHCCQLQRGTNRLRWVLETAQHRGLDPQGLPSSPVKDLVLHVVLWEERNESSSA